MQNIPLTRNNELRGKIHFPDRNLPPMHAAIKRNSEDNFRISVFIDSEDFREAEWWFKYSDFRYSETPSEATKFTTPKIAIFSGENKTITLIGCRTTGYKKYGVSVFIGFMEADAIIFGKMPGKKLGRIYGVQGDIDNLLVWTGVHFNHDHSNERTSNKISYSVTPPPPFEFGEYKGFKNLITFGLSEENSLEKTTFTRRSTVVSETNKPTTWENSLYFLKSISDLVTISADEPASIHNLFIKSCPEFPDEFTQIWFPTYYQGLNIREGKFDKNKVVSPFQHLIPYQKLKNDGVKKWLELKENFSRTITPLLATYHSKPIAAEQLVLMCGVAVEALSYTLRLEKDKWTESRARNENFSSRVLRLIDELNKFGLDIDLTWWGEDFPDAYNGVKHANRQLPNGDELATLSYTTKNILRSWIALELGIDPKYVKEKVASSIAPKLFFEIPDPFDL